MISLDACVWPECSDAKSTQMRLPLCDRHAIRVYREVSDAVDRAKEPAPKRQSRPQRNRRTTPGLVYFMRFGERIKIGYTSNLESRIRSLRPDEVLATMPGTMLDEEALQHRFGGSWLGREMFVATPELMAYIESLRLTA